MAYCDRAWLDSGGHLASPRHTHRQTWRLGRPGRASQFSLLHPLPVGIPVSFPCCPILPLTILCLSLGIHVPKGVHVGIHCFRHGVTSELLESGTPIHVVTRLMRHGDSQVTLNHYAHIIGNAERVAFQPTLSCGVFCSATVSAAEVPHQALQASTAASFLQYCTKNPPPVPRGIRRVVQENGRSRYKSI